MLRSLPWIVGILLSTNSPSHAGSADDPFAGAFAVNAVMNGDFESCADSTVSPPKYGSYWKDAFEYAATTTSSQVDELAPGQHALRLDPGRVFVRQALTLYGPLANRFAITLRVRRSTPEAVAHLLIKSGVNDHLHYTLADVDDAVGRGSSIARAPIAGPDAEGFSTYRLEVAQDLAVHSKTGPGPWLELHFGAERGVVHVDDVVGIHWLPRIAATELREMLLQEVREYLRIYIMPRDGDPAASPRGLGLVDPTTGYLTVGAYDCTTGKAKSYDTAVGIAGVHELGLRYYRTADASPDAAVLKASVKAMLRRHLDTLLERNVYEPTGLYTFVDPKTFAPRLELAVAPSHFIHHALDVAALFEDDAALHARVRERVLRMADALVAIRAQHDLPHAVQFGRGPGGNWFGRMPEKMHPDGQLDQPKTYNQAWAISQNRSWYYDFQTAHGLVRAWTLDPKDEYLQTALLAIKRFDRKFDATRYDLENDTDDHYGFNVESLLKAFEAGGRQVPEFRALAQEFTDYRLPRDTAWDKNLWIEGVRLGSFCAGDQPRAYRGPTGLYRLDANANPSTSRYEPYLFAVRELARGDMKHRLLDDGYTQDASAFMWTMISACYLSNFIGPCSMNLKWEGDMGDLFVGPSGNGFRALSRAIEISQGGGGAHEFVAWYGVVFDHTMDRFRELYGYRSGMSVETGKRYGIPDRYLSGFSNESPYGLSCVLAHAELVESGALDESAPHIDQLEVVAGDDGNVRVRVRGPRGAQITVRVSDRAHPRQLGVVDWRLRMTAEPVAPPVVATLDDDGAADVGFTYAAKGRIIVEAELAGDGPLCADLLASERVFD